jgi:hypothetical protein
MGLDYLSPLFQFDILNNILYNIIKSTIKDMIMTIMANEVKTKGVSIFDTLLKTFSEVIINVRGKNKYCVIPYSEYEAYRSYKLDIAHKEVMKDIANGNYHNNLQKHFDNIETSLNDD